MPAKIYGSSTPFPPRKPTSKPAAKKSTDPFATSNTARTGADFDRQLDGLINQGWSIVSDGPSGVKLAGKKKWRLLDLLCLILGVAAVWFFPVLGIVLMGAAFIDYALLTKPQERFLRRPAAATDKPSEAAD